jgi:multidrug efflux pump
MTLSLLSDDPRFDEIYLSNFATINVLDVLRRIPGVGRVSNVGSRYYGMQIWVYPDRLANMGLTVKDLQNASLQPVSWENNQYWMSISLCLLLPEDVCLR